MLTKVEGGRLMNPCSGCSRDHAHKGSPLHSKHFFIGVFTHVRCLNRCR